MDRERIRTKNWPSQLLGHSSYSFFLLLFTTLLRSAIGHVTLTYPKAIYPPLDFLDNDRTIGPCGLPKSDRSETTIFKVGELYNITWRMQSPHKGLFRFTMFDQSGAIVTESTLKTEGNSTEFVGGRGDDSAEAFPIYFTNECQNCTLLLERQALEWGNQSYLFRSCADVRVVKRLKQDEECSGAGARYRGNEGPPDKQCNCERNRSGPECQYQDDCTDDTDCGPGGQGKCLQDVVNPNQRSCFCSYGFFGVNCRRRSDADPNDMHCFAHEGLRVNDDGDFLYGLFNESCYNKSILYEETDDVIYWRVLGTQMELILDFETRSWVSIGWRPLNIPKVCRLSPLLFAGNSGAIDPRMLDDFTGVKTNGYLKSALKAPLHPMDCTDLVMASVRDGNWLHLEDLYTRDRSTPLRDDWLDGEQSLSAAYGLEREGRTVVMFRRMIKEIEPTDHPLGPGKMHVIHAKGRKMSIAKSHRNISTTAKFYKDDQWKYHGEAASNRGEHELEFVTAEQMSRFKWPLIHLDPVDDKASPPAFSGGPNSPISVNGPTPTQQNANSSEDLDTVDLNKTDVESTSTTSKLSESEDLGGTNQIPAENTSPTRSSPNPPSSKPSDFEASSGTDRILTENNSPTTSPPNPPSLKPLDSEASSGTNQIPEETSSTQSPTTQMPSDSEASTETMQILAENTSAKISTQYPKTSRPLDFLSYINSLKFRGGLTSSSSDNNAQTVATLPVQIFSVSTSPTSPTQNPTTSKSLDSEVPSETVQTFAENTSEKDLTTSKPSESEDLSTADTSKTEQKIVENTSPWVSTQNPTTSKLMESVDLSGIGQIPTEDTSPTSSTQNPTTSLPLDSVSSSETVPENTLPTQNPTTPTPTDTIELSEEKPFEVPANIPEQKSETSVGEPAKMPDQNTLEEAPKTADPVEQQTPAPAAPVDKTTPDHLLEVNHFEEAPKDNDINAHKKISLNGGDTESEFFNGGVVESGSIRTRVHWLLIITMLAAFILNFMWKN